MAVFIDDLFLQPASNPIYISLGPINTHTILGTPRSMAKHGDKDFNSYLYPL